MGFKAFGVRGNILEGGAFCVCDCAQNLAFFRAAPGVVRPEGGAGCQEETKHHLHPSRKYLKHGDPRLVHHSGERRTGTVQLDLLLRPHLTNQHQQHQQQSDDPCMRAAQPHSHPRNLQVEKTGFYIHDSCVLGQCTGDQVHWTPLNSKKVIPSKILRIKWRGN